MAKQKSINKHWAIFIFFSQQMWCVLKRMIGELKLRTILQMIIFQMTNDKEEFLKIFFHKFHCFTNCFHSSILIHFWPTILFYTPWKLLWYKLSCGLCFRSTLFRGATHIRGETHIRGCQLSFCECQKIQCL